MHSGVCIQNVMNICNSLTQYGMGLAQTANKGY